MRTSLRFAALAVSVVMAAFATGCEDTSQPDIDEAFGGKGSNTQESELTSSTSSAASSGDTVEEPGPTPEQADETDPTDTRNRYQGSAKSNIRDNRGGFEGG